MNGWNRVHKSINGGGLWETSGITGAGSICSSLAIDPKTPAVLYVGTPMGPWGSLFQSTDAGAHWSAMNTGLNKGLTIVPVQTLAVDPTTTTTVYAATSDHGVLVVRPDDHLYLPSL